MKKRTIKQIIEGVATTQFEHALNIYAGTDAREAELNAKLVAETSRIKAQYSNELTVLAEQKQNALEVVQTYCREQKESLFSKRRSIGTPHGTLGFRLGNPKLKPVKGYKWENILELLKQKLPDYVRIYEEPAKDLLLTNRNQENVAPLLKEIGVQVVQEEVFFIELKRAA